MLLSGMSDTKDDFLNMRTSGDWSKTLPRSVFSNKLSAEEMMRGSSNENAVMNSLRMRDFFYSCFRFWDVRKK